MMMSTSDLLVLIGCALAAGIGMTTIGILIEFALRKKKPAPLPAPAERQAAQPPAAQPVAATTPVPEPQPEAAVRKSEIPPAEPPSPPSVPVRAGCGPVPSRSTPGRKRDPIITATSRASSTW